MNDRDLLKKYLDISAEIDGLDMGEQLDLLEALIEERELVLIEIEKVGLSEAVKSEFAKQIEELDSSISAKLEDEAARAQEELTSIKQEINLQNKKNHALQKYSESAGDEQNSYFDDKSL